MTAHSRRWTIGWHALILLVVSIAGQAQAPARLAQNFDIPAQNTGDALNAFSKQSGLRLLFSYDAVEGRRTDAIRGSFTPEEALKKLLAGTGLHYEVTADSVVLIRAAQSSSSISAETSEASAMRLAGAIVQPGAAAQSEGSQGARNDAAGSQETDAAKQTVSEIVVTAQKRVERLRDVPIPVAAIDANALINSNQLRLQDYASSIPGLSLSPANARGAPVLAIRGIATGETNPTVGVTVDDVPFGSSTSSAGGFFVPDLDPSDLERIEVLRGPQGTLYGASSMGGMLKFVTVDPSTEAVSGVLQVGGSAVSDGNQGHSARAAVNIPLGDAWALRASGFTRRDPGYIDNVQTGERDVNWSDAYGGRLSALWRASAFSLKLGALFQERKMHGSPFVYVQPGLEELQQNTLRGSRGPGTRFQAYSAELKARVGSVDLTSVSGFGVNEYSDVLDSTPSLGGQAQARFGVGGAANHEDWKTEKFSQEIRLSAPLGRRVEWLLGGFYSHDKSTLITDLPAVSPATGAAAGLLLYQVGEITFEEYAAFLNLTFHVTDRFDVQVGGRQSQNKQRRDTPVLAGALAGTPTIGRSDDDAFTYLLTPRLKLSSELMLYARLASSYRPGGFNSFARTGVPPGLPTSYDPDKTISYEIGAKGGAFDDALSFDASVYYIDWRDIQVLQFLVGSSIGYTGNPGRAKSEGVELSVHARPWQGMNVAVWAAWNDAELTEAFPPQPLSSVFGLVGDRLPYSSRISGNLSLDQEFPVGSMTGFVGAAVSYVGDRKGVFTRTAARQTLPAYAKTDLRAGLKYDQWTVNLYVNNVTDRRGLLTGGLGTSIPVAFYYIQPRTIGLSLSRVF